MNWQRLAVSLAAVNLVLLAWMLAQGRPALAQAVTPVLRGRALELVDDHGRLRAEIKVLPAQPTLRMPDGTVGYPDGAAPADRLERWPERQARGDRGRIGARSGGRVGIRADSGPRRDPFPQGRQQGRPATDNQRRSESVRPPLAG